MIQHFETIENLGVFFNYKKPQGMKPFQRFNLIYGLNGSGKTTLSRFFADLNAGQANGFPSLKYKIQTTDGNFQQGKPYTRKIRVFNTEYVDANFGQFEGPLNPIYVIGTENKALVETVKADQDRLSKLEQDLLEKQAKLKKIETQKGRLFTEVAPKITQAAQGATLRKYNKTNAEKAYNALTIPVQLTPEDQVKASTAMKQSAMDKLTEFKVPQIQLGEAEKPLFEALNLQFEAVSKTLQKSATSTAIAKLKTNPAIAAWVEGGREIHVHSDDGKCAYCLQIIPKEREAELAAHFNTSDSILKQEIERAIDDSKVIYEEVERIIGLSEQTLYPEFRDEFSVNSKVLGSEQLKILKHLEGLQKALEEKLARRTESYHPAVSELSGDSWTLALTSLNALIRCHNSETDDFEKRLGDNFAKIETHFLSAIDQDVKTASAEIKTMNGEITVCTDGDANTKALGIEALKERIRENQAKISNSQQAAMDLSQKLAAFLGRGDLKFEPEGEGYRIMRFGRAAKRLSEGEKTAITFLYFVVGLGDKDFDLSEGIVVIDDPLSSLDSSSIYQAFSYLKNSVKDAKQVFLLTHNFEFLKLLLNWFQQGIKSKSYWMLHCTNTSSTQRETTIQPLDEVLMKNKSEFTYLLKILVDFKSDGKIANSYHIPNILRKVLETFLAQHSTGESFYRLLDNLEYDETKKSALYKYANDQSHPTLSGLDPALVGETQTNIKHLLEMIESVAPVHYQALKKTIKAKETLNNK